MEKTTTNPKLPFVVKVDPLIRELLPGYLSNRAQDVRHLEDALEAGDFARLRQIGHNMRGSGAGYGLPPISEFGARLEAAAQAQDSGALRGAIGDLRLFLETVKLAPP